MHCMRVVLACALVAACSKATLVGAGARRSTTPPIVAPTVLPVPDRICEPLGWVPSPDGRWIAYLRRAEWDREGFQIPYQLTELWIQERGSGHRRRLLDYTRLSPEWSRSFAPNSTPFGAAGGFSFRLLSWSPDSTAIALEEAGDDWIFRGSVVVEIERERIIELEGGGLAWSPDGSRAVLCKGHGLDCPDGLLLVDLGRGEVRHDLAGIDVNDYGWHRTGLVAVAAYLKEKDRYGWWVYDPGIGSSSLQPVEWPSIVDLLPPTTTWWAPEPGEPLPCNTTARHDSQPAR